MLPDNVIVYINGTIMGKSVICCKPTRRIEKIIQVHNTITNDRIKRVRIGTVLRSKDPIGKYIKPGTRTIEVKAIY